MLRVFFHLNKIRSFIHLIGFDFTLMLHDVLWTIGEDRYLSSRKFSLDWSDCMIILFSPPHAFQENVDRSGETGIISE